MKVIYDMYQIERCARHVKDVSKAFSDDSVRQISNVLLKEVMDLSLGNFNPYYIKYGVIFSCELNQIDYDSILTVTVTPEGEEKE